MKALRFDRAQFSFVTGASEFFWCRFLHTVDRGP